jgi:hypothetical protein
MRTDRVGQFASKSYSTKRGTANILKINAFGLGAILFRLLRVGNGAGEAPFATGRHTDS